MNNTQYETHPAAFDESVIATYLTHADAEAAVRQLSVGGIPLRQVSIIGRHFETREDIQGFYQPADAAIAGAGQGAWFGSFFGLMAGAMGFFVFPLVGTMLILGPLAGLIAGAMGGAGIGALVDGLMATGVPRNQALKYQDRLQAGEFLVVVHGVSGESAQAHQILESSKHTHLQLHSAAEAR